MLQRVLVLTIASVLVWTTAVQAKKKKFEWDQITPADWNVQVDSARDIHEAAYLFERIRADEKKLVDGKIYRTIYRRLRIVSEGGREWADVDFVHRHKKQKMELIAGRTVLRDGTIIELDPEKVITKEVVKSRGKEVKQTSFSLPGVTDDCIIEYVVTYRLPTFVPTWSIQKNIPVLKAEMMWIIPQWDMTAAQAEVWDDFITPNYLWLNTHERPTVEQLPNLKKAESLLFVVENVPPFEPEPYSVTEETLKTRLICYPGPKKDAMAYWGDQAADITKWMEKFCNKNKRVRKVVERFEYMTDENEKVGAVFKWMRDHITNVGYVTVKDEKGKEIKLKDRDSADDVLKRAYGDNGDINYVFCDMLRELNVDATIVYCRDRFDDLFVRAAKYWQFDRNLVRVDFKDGTHEYYAPGYMHTEFEQIPWWVEGTTGLIGGGEVSLETIPFGSMTYNTTERIFRYAVDEDLAVEGELNILLKGQPARSLRVKVEDEDSTDFKNLIVDKIDDDFLDVELELVSHENLGDCTKPLKLKFTIEQNDLSTAGDKILLKPFDYGGRTENPFYSPERTRDILFDYAEKVRETVEFELPEGMTLEALPADTTYKNQIGECAVTMQLVGNTLKVQRVFTLKQVFIPIDFYRQVRNLFQARQQMAEQVVVLKFDDEA